MLQSTKTWAAALIALAMTYCGEGSEDTSRGENCVGGKCDAVGDATGACDVQEVVGSLEDNDDILARVLKTAEACPTTYAEVAAAVIASTPGCTGQVSPFPDPNETADFFTAIISETAQLLGFPGQGDYSRGEYAYRTVTGRNCESNSDILFSTVGSRPGAPLPENVEVIARQTFEVDGVRETRFNYYDLRGGQWVFHGSSIDFIEGRGGDCKACHPSGGLVMKELAAPWIHWDPNHGKSKDALLGEDPNAEPGDDFATPGVARIVREHADILGEQMTGRGLEAFTIIPANSTWNETRLRHLLRTGNLRQLLRPLFCDTEVIVGAGGAEGAVPRIFSSALIDAAPGFEASGGAFQAFTSIEIDEEHYASRVEELQFVSNTPGGRGLQNWDDRELIANDVDFPLAHATRSHTDLDLIELLKVSKVIDVGLQRAIAAVDLTRPVLSKQRCDLWSNYVEDIGPLLADGSGDADPDAGLGEEDDEFFEEERFFEPIPAIVAGTSERIRQMLRHNLSAAADRDPAAAELLANLDVSAAELDARARQFLDACSARPVQEFMDDYFVVLGHQRRAAEALPQFESHSALATFPQMRDDRIDLSGDPRLDPDTCELRRD